MAAMYAIYHGPEGLKVIADRVHGLASVFAAGVSKVAGAKAGTAPFFDTVRVSVTEGLASNIVALGHGNGVNLRLLDPSTVRLLSLPFYLLRITMIGYQN
jgi:glycine dehydrogenase